MSFEKICIIHLNQIGDLVFSLPLLKALRDNFPGASIHSVVKPYLGELLSDSPYVDVVIRRENGLKSKVKLLRKIRRAGYDLLITLSHSEECLLLTALSKARIKAGFSHFPWDLCLDIKEKIEGHNSWHNNSKLLKHLNIAVSKNDYVGLINIKDSSDYPGLPEKFVIIAPGASSKRFSKTWEHNKFAELILLLEKNYGLIPVLVGGRENMDYNSRIISILQERNVEASLVNFTGKLSLRALCSVLKAASLFVGIDSGIMHLASSMDIPVVGLFGPTDPFFVGPQNSRSIVVREEEMKCVPCYLRDCKHRDCMRKLEVNKVFHACEFLLNHQAHEFRNEMRKPF
ncbi:MAG: glycosyltransferase family 9 protein, partial [Candidatus Kuenenia sp.]|nr:glycosyltransferase family 9 protein [Candidatus Kuenenia sp.]